MRDEDANLRHFFQHRLLCVAKYMLQCTIRRAIYRLTPRSALKRRGVKLEVDMKETKTARQAETLGAAQAAAATDAATLYREFAERGAQQAKAGYERFKALAEDATATLEDSYAAVNKGLAEINLSGLRAAQENANAAFD